MRFFFAVWPDADTRALLADAASALGLPSHARRVPPENFHLTLAFVGEVSDGKLAVLLEIGSGQRAAPCTLELGAFDYWPQPRVVVVRAAETPAALMGLSNRLYQHLSVRNEVIDCGRPLEPRPAPLRPHVTLARKVAQAPVLPAMSAIPWSASSFSLVRSHTGGGHSVYTVVATWPLLDENPAA